MKIVSDWWMQQVLRGGTPRLVAESWLEGRLLATLPVVPGSWRIETDCESQIPGRVSMQVPNTAEWRPLHPEHPLGGFGQQLRISVGYQRPDGSSELVRIGSFRMDRPKPSGATLTVQGVGLLAAVQDAKLLSTFRTDRLTRGAVVDRLLSGILPVVIELADQYCPAFVEEENRLKAVLDVVEAWPARLWIDEQGAARVSEPWDDVTPSDPVAEIAEAQTLTRDGVSIDPDPKTGPNAYRVESRPEGDDAAMSVVETIETGPMRWGGPYGYRAERFATSLVSPSYADLRAIGRALCERAARRTDAYLVKSSPRYELEIGDVIRVRAGLTNIVGRITALTHTAIATEAKVAYLSGDRGTA